LLHLLFFKLLQKQHQGSLQQQLNFLNLNCYKNRIENMILLSSTTASTMGGVNNSALCQSGELITPRITDERSRRLRASMRGVGLNIFVENSGHLRCRESATLRIGNAGSL
jgi:hypothetical protein